MKKKFVGLFAERKQYFCNKDVLIFKPEGEGEGGKMQPSTPRYNVRLLVRPSQVCSRCSGLS